ncbi:MAG: carbonic anhydrase [Candidatus Omnitrophica bacterium]|nr:carbonic anhydrase [Candidatus Omnitrophota bacterium]
MIVAGISALANTDHPAMKPSPDEALQILKEGNGRFMKGESQHPNSTKERLILAGKENQGDYAIATVVTCSDSRVPVERVFDAGVMDIFVIRIAGNVCDIDEVGSIEYGLAHVHTPVLVILGHTQCGAVTAVCNMLEGKAGPLEKNIPPLIDNIFPAARKTMQANPTLHGSPLIEAAVEQNVYQGIEDLFKKSLDTRELVNQGKVKVLGAIYDVGTGEIRWLDEKKPLEILKQIESDSSRPAEKPNTHAPSPTAKVGQPAPHLAPAPLTAKH